MIGRRRPASFATGLDQPAVALRTTPQDVPLRRADAVAAAVANVEAGHLDVLVDVDPRPADLLREPPDHRVVPDDPARRVVERAEDRPGHVLRDVDLRADRFTSSRSITRLEIPSSLFTSAARLDDQRAVGVREREVPVLREHQGEAELGREPLVELDALLVRRPLRRAVVRADDGGVPSRRTGADVALLEDRDVRDPVTAREVGRGEAVRAAADDDDVVVPELPGLCSTRLRRKMSFTALLPCRERVHPDQPPRGPQHSRARPPRRSARAPGRRGS